MPDNTIEWGQGAVNNTNDWGKAKANSTNNFGAVYDDSPSGDTNIAGGQPAVSITYPNSDYCGGASDPTPTVQNNAGAGTFSSTTGLVFVSTSTGEVDLSASTAGATYVITYTDTDSATATFNFTITAFDDATFSYSDSSYAQNLSDPTPTITGLAGGTFSGSTGLVINSTTGEIDLDASTIAPHTVTYDTTSSGSSVCPNTSTQTVNIVAELAQVNNVYSMAFDGANDYIDLGDSDDLSFGNGTTDSPFSISAWVNMTDATSFVTIAKDATSNREYVIRTLSDDKLYFYLLDNVNGGYIGRISSGTVTSYQGTWIHTVYTYNGNSSSSGIKIYLNGSPVDNTNYQGGSYTAMSNTVSSLNIGRQESGVGTYANGKIDEVSIFDVELTAQDIQRIYLATETGKTADLNDLTTPPVKWYRMD